MLQRRKNTAKPKDAPQAAKRRGRALKSASRPQRAPRHRQHPDPLALHVGTRIKRLRQEYGFNFDSWVEETGLGRGYVSELDRGLVVPTVHALQKCADALELPMADLVLDSSLREQIFERTRPLSDEQLQSTLKFVSGYLPDGELSALPLAAESAAPLKAK